MYNNFDKDIEALYETNKYGYKYLRYDRIPAPELVKEFVSKYKINTNCHSSCVVCQINQIVKYKSELETKNQKSIKEQGKELEKWFPISCDYITKGLPSEYKEIIKKLIEEKGIPERKAKRMLFASVDPSSWVELMFAFDDETKKIDDMEKHWYLRWYQKHALRCTAKKKVLRWGRRSGKSATSALTLIEKIFNHKVFKGINPETGEEIFSGPTIAIVAPFQSQVAVIFDELERFIRTNKQLQDQVIQTGSKLYRQTPPLCMLFKNGGSIEGYITGTNNKEDGSGGGTIRGITADIVYLEEMDLIPENIYKKVISPLQTSKPNIYFYGSSTPIGKKGTFYNWCLASPAFKEIYLPSTALPHWELVEQDALDESTQESFKAEYMAEFITDSYGVFKSQYIQEARENYNYSDFESFTTNELVEFFSKNFNENYYEFIKCMGIDWNKNYGTEYSIIGWSPRTGKFWTLENFLCPPSTLTYEGYKSEVRRLNYKWQPKYIYADEGHGNTLIENLQVESAMLMSKVNKTDYDISVISILERLKPFNFSSNVELYNPGTGTYFKKYAKNFLVENTVQIFERNKIKFSESDKILIKQLGNYIQLKKMDNGRIIYGMENESIGDHRLDAFMLSLGGLVIEESIFSTNELGTSDVHFRDREDDDVDVVLNQVNDLTKLIKRENKNNENSYNKWREQFNNAQSSDFRKNLDPIKASKGIFSKNGLAQWVETNSKEDREDINTAMKINKRVKTIRTNWR